MRDSLEQKRGLKVSDITIWRALRRCRAGKCERIIDVIWLCSLFPLGQLDLSLVEQSSQVFSLEWFMRCLVSRCVEILDKLAENIRRVHECNTRVTQVLSYLLPWAIYTWLRLDELLKIILELHKRNTRGTQVLLLVALSYLHLT